MISISASGELPSRDDLAELYASVGWTTYQDEVLVAAVQGSSFVVCAREHGALLGLARAISDDASICYLQDVLVRPVAQRRGVGRSLVAAVLDRYAHVRQTVLLTDDEPRQSAFYAALGFREAHEVGALHCYVRFVSA